MNKHTTHSSVEQLDSYYTDEKASGEESDHLDIEQLVQMLYDSQRREEATKMLIKILTKRRVAAEDIKPLLSALENKNPNVQKAATTVLTNSSPSVIQSLIEMLPFSGAVKGLVAIGVPSVQSLLQFMLSQNFDSPQWEAANRVINAISAKKDRNWATWVIQSLIHPFIIFALPMLLLGLIIYLIYEAFTLNVYFGVRSLGTVIFPFIIMAFIYKFSKEILKGLHEINPRGAFLISFIWGVIVMALIHLSGQMIADFPVAELVLAGTLALLVYNYAERSVNSVLLVYYYGVICGFLIYVMFLGLPPNMFRIEGFRHPLG
jgi:hypothetical protein